MITVVSVKSTTLVNYKSKYKSKHISQLWHVYPIDSSNHSGASEREPVSSEEWTS